MDGFFNVGQVKAFQNGLLLLFGARLAHEYINPTVAQIEGNRASHIAIANDADALSREDIQIAVFVMINDRHVYNPKCSPATECRNATTIPPSRSLGNPRGLRCKRLRHPQSAAAD